MKRLSIHKISKKVGQFLIIIGIFAGSFSSPLLGADAANPDVKTLYHQGIKLFRDANTIAATDSLKAQALYQKALMRFERIVKEGNIHNGKLYYDIGNIYFRTEDIGRAILNYRRARLFIPNDQNLQQNLDFARANRIDHIEEKQKTRILKTLFFWHYDLSTRTRVFIFSSFFMLLWIFATIRIFSRRTFTAWCLAVTAVLSLLFAGSLMTEHIVQQKERPGVVITPEVIARKGNSKTYEQSFKEPLHAGTEFTLIEKRGDWYHIELMDSRKCWVARRGVELVR